MTWLIVLLAGLLLDATGTWQVIRREGVRVENMPLSRSLIARCSTLADQVRAESEAGGPKK